MGDAAWWIVPLIGGAAGFVTGPVGTVLLERYKHRRERSDRKTNRKEDALAAFAASLSDVDQELWNAMRRGKPAEDLDAAWWRLSKQRHDAEVLAPSLRKEIHHAAEEYRACWEAVVSDTLRETWSDIYMRASAARAIFNEAYSAELGNPLPFSIRGNLNPKLTQR